MVICIYIVIEFNMIVCFFNYGICSVGGRNGEVFFGCVFEDINFVVCWLCVVVYFVIGFVKCLERRLNVVLVFFVKDVEFEFSLDDYDFFVVGVEVFVVVEVG